MTDKVQKIRKEVERLMKELIQEKEKGFGSDSDDACILELQNVLTYIDSLQEEPVSIWHDPSKETPIQHSNILMIRKEEGSDFPPIAGCFHGTNSRLDGRNWGYYNGFCYNEIEPPLKWAYVDDLLILSNVERTVKDWKEPVSEELEQAAVEAFKQIVDSDKNNFLEIFKAGAEWQKQKDSMLVSEDLEEAAFDYAETCKYDGGEKLLCVEHFKAGAKWGKNQAMAEIQAQSMALVHECPKENTSENLKEAADNALESISDQYDIISVGSCLEMFRLGAEWQREQEYTCYEEAFEDGTKWKKEKTIDKACKWIEEKAAKYLVDRFVGSTRVVGIDTSITEDFRKNMED